MDTYIFIAPIRQSPHRHGYTNFVDNLSSCCSCWLHV